MGYTFDPHALLSEPLMANLSTSSDEGPRNAPVWFLWEDEAIWMLGSKNGSSVSRLKADPRCALEIVHFDNKAGILLHLGLRGRASIEQTNPMRFRRLLAKYLGPDEGCWNAWFIQNVAAIDDHDGRMIRLIPSTTYTNNVFLLPHGSGPGVAI